MYTETIEMIDLRVNNTNQIETLYYVVGTNDGVEVFRRREGRVWSPTDDIASDKLSGSHPDVKKLAAAYWSPKVVTAYAADVIDVATAKRDKIEAARVALEAATAEHDAAKAAHDTAKAIADKAKTEADFAVAVALSAKEKADLAKALGL